MPLEAGLTIPYTTDDPILSQIGDTPLIKFPDEDVHNLFCKLEKENPTGSMKDRIAMGIISEQMRNGEFDTVVEASSGNTGGAVALVANRLGLDCHITCTETTSKQKVGYMKAFGAQVHKCPPVEEGHPEHYHSVAENIAEEEETFFMNQYSNLGNPEVHYRWTGPEVWNQIGDEMTHFICPMGTGGTISGCARYFKEQAAKTGRDVTVVGVDAELSNISSAFYGVEEGPYRTSVEGLGKGSELPTMWFDYIDEIRDVDDERAFDYARMSAREHGLLIGPSSGATLSIALDIRESCPDSSVVSMVCDGGEQYFDTLFC